MTARFFLDWHSTKNYSFLNPRLPSKDAKHLMTILESAVLRPAPARDSFISASSIISTGHIFLLSSGTTAASRVDLKWTALSKSAFLASAASVNHHLGLSAADIWLNPLPTFHVGGLAIWARSFLNGAKVITLPKWSTADFMTVVTEHNVTITALVPTQMHDLVSEGCRSPGSLRGVVLGAGALSPALATKARELGWPVVPTYGMTEACSQIATAVVGHSSSGLQILPHLEVYSNINQQLCFRGDSLLTAYIYSDPYSATPTPMVEDPKVDGGWFHSQDRGLVENHCLRILGRTADFIKIGGESVELGRLNQIFDEIRIELNVRADLALLPVPDARLGNVIHLISDSRLSEPQANQIIERFNFRVLAFEKIRQWQRTDQIPRTALGKFIPAACLEKLAPLP